jgi:hypothetical protein
VNIPTPAAPASTGGGWGVSSFWSTATSAIQSAQKIADEGYKRVKEEGVQSVTGLSQDLDLGRLRKGAEERFGGIVKGVDLEKLSESSSTIIVTSVDVVPSGHDLLSNTMSGLTTILNTVAPPISAHETLELWLSHPMIGYDGVEGVVYRAWTRVLEQTESGELIVIWSPDPQAEDGKDGLEGPQRGIYPVAGWTEGSDSAGKALESLMGREDKDPQGRVKGKGNRMPYQSPYELRTELTALSVCTRHDSPDIPSSPTSARTSSVSRTSRAFELGIIEYSVPI